MFVVGEVVIRCRLFFFRGHVCSEVFMGILGEIAEIYSVSRSVLSGDNASVLVNEIDVQ